MRLLSKVALVAVLALGFASVSRAQDPINPLLPTTGTREISFSGLLGFEPARNFTLSLGYGPFLNPNLQIGAATTISDPEGGASAYSLGGFVNYHFPGASAALPYIGAFLGYTDGSQTDGDISYGLQAGVKYFLNSSVSAFGELQYRDSDGPSTTGLVFGLNVYLR